MTVRLRPHHLLCLLTYAGKGYTAAFIVNYNQIAQRLSQAEDILIVSGPDDICTPLLSHNKPHCINKTVIKRDQKATTDLIKYLSCNIAYNERFTLNAKILHQMRRLFANGQIRTACIGCEWHTTCSLIALNNYRNVLVSA